MADEFDYTIAAIPTSYKGRRYRSRLEARWAAFFDLMGWCAEYEPFDLGKWSPDFVLAGPYGSKVLVEVKPVSGFHGATAARMTQAAAMCSDAILLLVGISPRPSNGVVGIGWSPTLADVEDWRVAPIGWSLAHERPGVIADIYLCSEDVMDDGLYWFGALWHDCVPAADRCFHYADQTMRIWAEAANAVQWQGPRK